MTTPINSQGGGVSEFVPADIPAGTDISAAAVRLVGAANVSGCPAECSFNGVRLRADPGTDPAAVADRYSRHSEERARRYRESPEGRARAAAEAADVARLQATADELLRDLAEIDFGDQPTVLRWLGDLQPCTDRIGVKVRRSDVVAAFAGHGLVPNMCCGDAFDADDRDTYFRWLVGQALDGLTRGPAVHGVFHKFAAEWLARWEAA
jgi:hypothetical protein